MSAQPDLPPKTTSPGVRFGIFKHQCASNDEIQVVERRAVDAAALSFVTTAFESDPEIGYAVMTSEARSSMTSSAFVAGIRAATQQAGKFRNVKVDRTYLVETSGIGSVGRAICGVLKDNQWVSVAIKPGLKQAHVTIAAQTLNNDWQLSVWLLPEGNDWKVHNLHVGVSSLAGQSAEAIFQLARRERGAGHTFNAMMLYVALRNLIYRGPFFQLGLTQTVDEDYRGFKPPPEAEGEPPYTWTMNGTAYTVGHVSIVAIEGKLGLVFALPQREWKGDSEADKSNCQFLTAFVATHPEHDRVFGFLVARAGKPDGSGGFGTVYQVGKGFTGR